MVQRRFARRTATTAATAAAALVFAVGVAGTAGAVPQRTPTPSGLPLTFDAGFVCDFPVLVEEAEPSALELIDFGGGRTVTRGRLVVELTNVETGRSVVRDISGPVTTKGDRQTFFSPSITAVLPGSDPHDLLPGDEPGLVFLRGIFVFEGGMDGGTFTRVTGEPEDICATLSGPPA
jgi:hypothetical protein